jgi:hypothetical protein
MQANEYVFLGCGPTQEGGLNRSDEHEVEIEYGDLPAELRYSSCIIEDEKSQHKQCVMDARHPHLEIDYVS